MSPIPAPAVGRVPVRDVRPLVECGRRPAKAVVGETFEVTATLFREGHGVVAANVVLKDPEGRPAPWTTMRELAPGTDRWGACVTPTAVGRWTYRVEAWSDPIATWRHTARIKIPAGIDSGLVLEEGAELYARAAAGVPEADLHAVLLTVVRTLRDDTLPVADRLAAALAPEVDEVLARHPLRELVTSSEPLPLLVERERALFGSWYEFFPRSEGTPAQPHGTFRTAARRLPAIAAMGFDVVYLPPIHPIGTTFRKGRNNTLSPTPDDVGVPWAIGSPEGGHDSIHPDLGTLDDFDHFVAQARALGLEIALDFALQCSPDHPWVGKHPEWFHHRPDGTIAYAENPPKKYQDIYPLNFDNDPAGIYAEVRRVVQVWIDHGVKLFRVDNPHTKPVEFWQWLIEDVAKDHPDVIWLAEAFTKPAMMHTLGKIGFQQSYTYYAWRNSAAELREYVTELSGDAATYMRPSFWPTTHDILTPYMQFGGVAAWKLRAVLAATLVPTYGIYTGYELMEHVARPGAEEQIDNEKYEFKNRRWEDYEEGGPKEGRSLAGYLTRINEIRRAHPSLHRLRDITFHHVDDENFLAFSKRRRLPDGTDDVVVVVANLDPHSTRATTLRLDMSALGLESGDSFAAHDLVTDQTWTWQRDTYVRLGPEVEPVHVVALRRDW
jgi:starch synthase (maltosyl-transferring)